MLWPDVIQGSGDCLQLCVMERIKKGRGGEGTQPLWGDSVLSSECLGTYREKENSTSWSRTSQDKGLAQDSPGRWQGLAAGS